MEQTPETHRLLAVAAVVYFLNMLAFNFMTSFLSLFLRQDFGVNLTEATFWTGVVLLFKQSSYAIGSPMWGWLSDRVGSKKMLIRVVVGHTIAHFLMFISGNIYQFAAFQCLDAALGSMSTPMYALLANTIEPKKLPQAISYVMSIQTVGSLLGPSIGGAVSYYLGYRPTFLAASLIFASILVPIIVFLPDVKSSKNIEETEEVQVNRKIMSYLRFIDFDFAGLLLIHASIGFINPIVPYSLQSLGVTENAQQLYYTTILATLSGAFYAVVSPIGTRYLKRKYLPILPFTAMIMAIGQCFPINVTLFMALTIGIRAVQGPVQSNLFGGGMRRRSGAQMGILNTGQYIGGAIAPFIAATIATTISLTAAFACMAAIQLVAVVFLLLRNKRMG